MSLRHDRLFHQQKDVRKWIFFRYVYVVIWPAQLRTKPSQGEKKEHGSFNVIIFVSYFTSVLLTSHMWTRLYSTITRYISERWNCIFIVSLRKLISISVRQIKYPLKLIIAVIYPYRHVNLKIKTVGQICECYRRLENNSRLGSAQFSVP